jgi:hypothetical protein
VLAAVFGLVGVAALAVPGVDRWVSVVFLGAAACYFVAAVLLRTGGTRLRDSLALPAAAGRMEPADAV